MDDYAWNESKDDVTEKLLGSHDVKPKWTDVGVENQQAGRTEAVVGVCFRSPCGGWMVTQDDLRKPEHARRWVVWDVRHGQQRNALAGSSFATREMGIEAADILRGSMTRRLSSGLASVFRAHWRSLLGSVRAVLAAEVEP